MTIKDAYEKANHINRIAENIRLLNQYFLNQSPEIISDIEETHGLSMPIKNVLSETEELLKSEAKHVKLIVDNTDVILPI